MTTTLNIRGHEVLLDSDISFDINPLMWECRVTRGRPYFRTVCRAGGVRKTAWLHRVVALCPNGKQVDHINGNPLDNRKLNLRVCTLAQNLQNRGKRKNGSTCVYKGVYRAKHPSGGKHWHAQIFHGKKIHLGFFHTPEEGARAYNAAALKYHGEFSNLNQVEALSP